jgi:hypothetical protein
MLGRNSQYIFQAEELMGFALRTGELPKKWGGRGRTPRFRIRAQKVRKALRTSE